ncbi:MAG: hypothetical protein ACRDRJ_34025 [Streptosporangiaceae bacterium]
MFDDVAPGVLAAWRARVAAESPSHLRRHGDELKASLLAAYLHCRRREIADALADLLITTVQRINARADTKVTGEFVAELKRVSGKENILFKMTEAALEAPDEVVSEAISGAAQVSPKPTLSGSWSGLLLIEGWSVPVVVRRPAQAVVWRWLQDRGSIPVRGDGIKRSLDARSGEPCPVAGSPGPDRASNRASTFLRRLP